MASSTPVPHSIPHSIPRSIPRFIQFQVPVLQFASLKSQVSLSVKKKGSLGGRCLLKSFRILCYMHILTCYLSKSPEVALEKDISVLAEIALKAPHIHPHIHMDVYEFRQSTLEMTLLQLSFISHQNLKSGYSLIPRPHQAFT